MMTASTSTPDLLSLEDRALLDRLAERTVQWGMGTPAIFLLESMKPLNFVSSQVLLFFGPIVTSIFSETHIHRLAALLQKRETLELLILRIEAALDARSHVKPPPGA